jgi:hypothetical protein
VTRSVRPSDSFVVNPLDFYNPPRDSTRPLPVFYTRDVHPQLLLYGALAERGRRLGESILNYPPPGGWNPGDTLYDTELELGPRHEVLVTTRPPLDDKSFDEPKQVLRGYTLIEWQVMQALRPYFEHLSRSQLRLAQEAAEALRPGFETRRNIEIYQRLYAFFKTFIGAPRRERTPKKEMTAAFVLRKPGFRPDGSTLLAAFAMDGTMALVWSYLLARVHTDWLFEDGFRMVELSGPEQPDRPLDLRFALEWKVEEILHLAA